MIQQIPFLGIHLKARSQKDICTTLFIDQFTIANRWKPPRCPSMDEWIKKIIVYAYDGISFNLKKKGNPVCAISTNESRGHSAK